MINYVDKVRLSNVNITDADNNRMVVAVLNGVNCQNTYASGFAAWVGKHWPSAKADYHEWMNGKKPESMLGQIHMCSPIKNVIFIHGATQLTYGRVPNTKYASPEAVRMCVEKAINTCASVGIRHLYMPLIGCGLGGLDWETEVKEHIEFLANRSTCVTLHVVNEFVD